jgi:hypothetical protein
MPLPHSTALNSGGRVVGVFFRELEQQDVATAASMDGFTAFPEEHPHHPGDAATEINARSES